MPRPQKDSVMVIIHESKEGSPKYVRAIIRESKAGAPKYVCCFTTHSMTREQVIAGVRKMLSEGPVTDAL